MKLRYLIILIILVGYVGSYFIIVPLALGTYALSDFYTIIVYPSIAWQFIAQEGNGIICTDACGPCSAYGPWHILVDGQCVFPSEESCKLFQSPGDWKFEKGTCMLNCKEPYSDICKQEMIVETIRESVLKDCQPVSESSFSSPNILQANSTHHFDGNTCEWYESD